MMNKLLIICCLSASLCVESVVGQTNFDSVSIQLSDVDVKAQQLKLYSEMGRILTVIDRKAIDALPVRSLDDLLENIPGIDMRQRGVNGTQADISIRGGSFDQVLVLLNGVNITDPQTGHYNLDIPVELVDVVRIEILQGSSARVLGLNAFSGAINIVTERTDKKSLSAQATAGSYNSFSESISGSIGNEKIQTFASFSHKISDGHIKNTDYNNFNAFSQTVLRTKNAGKFNLQLAYQQKAYGADGFYHSTLRNQFENTQTLFGSLNWNMTKGRAQYNAQVYKRLHHDRFEFFRNFEGALSWYTSHYYHLTDVSGAKVKADFNSFWGKITVGLDLRNEHIYSTTLGKIMTEPVNDNFENGISFTKEDNRLSTTAYVDYSKSFGSVYVSAGAASTFNQQFGRYDYGGVDLGYSLNENTQLYVSANSAVRLPTFTDLYYSTGTHQADVNLKPESSKTIETGAKYNKKGFVFNLSGFYRMSNNAIDWVKYTGTPKFVSRNISEINAVGGELLMAYNFKSGFLRKISTNYSYVHLDKEAGTDYDSQYALDYLKHKVVFGIEHKIIKNLWLNWNLSYNDRAGSYMHYQSSQITDYKPYTMLNTRLNYVQKKYEIFADLNNLLNSRYVDYGGLTQPGTNFITGVRIKL